MKPLDKETFYGELPPLRETVRRHRINARRSLGQHFLFDLNLTRRITNIPGPLSEKTIIEIRAIIIILELNPSMPSIKCFQLNFFLYSLIFFLISFWINRNKELFGFVSVVSVMYIFILFFIYISTPLDLYFHLNSSAARVIKSLSFLIAFFGLYNLSNHKIKFYK